MKRLNINYIAIKYIAKEYSDKVKNPKISPVRFREFTDNSHIVVNMVTGNVYSMEAITELCYKNKNMKDLINDKPFKRADIVTVQG